MQWDSEIAQASKEEIEEVETPKMIATIEFEIPVYINYIQWDIKRRKWIGHVEKPRNNGSIPVFYTGQNKPVRHLRVVTEE